MRLLLEAEIDGVCWAGIFCLPLLALPSCSLSCTTTFGTEPAWCGGVLQAAPDRLASLEALPRPAEFAFTLSGGGSGGGVILGAPEGLLPSAECLAAALDLSSLPTIFIMGSLRSAREPLAGRPAFRSASFLADLTGWDARRSALASANLFEQATESIDNLLRRSTLSLTSGSVKLLESFWSR